MYHVFYHSVDLDGHSSGFLVKDHLIDIGVESSDINMRGINYGYKLDWDTISEGDSVWIVDFSLTQYDMGRLAGLVGSSNILWFDHHIANYTKMYEADPELKNIPGKRSNDMAGCELVFEHLYHNEANEEFHEILRRLGRYDGWWWKDMEDADDIINFQMGMRLLETDPSDSEVFDNWCEWMEDESFISKMTVAGSVINEYQEQQYAIIDRPRCMSIDISVGDKAYKVGAINSSHAGSQLFGDELLAKYDAVATWRYNGWGKYKVSFYSDKGNAEPIASSFGGGGHANAAGCQFTSFESFNRVFRLP
jgi:oligoribonuclease NrnB/cAMP/cGMP phosphodiesterase (DHH superfamily)